MYNVRDVCVVNAGVLKTSLVDAFDHCLGEVEPAAGNGYIVEHGLKGCRGCLFEVCHGAETILTAAFDWNNVLTAYLRANSMCQCCRSHCCSKSLEQYPYNFECGVRYVFGFVGEIIILRVVYISLRSLYRTPYICLLLFYSVIFQSCKFHPCDFVRHFPVLQIPVLQIQLSHLKQRLIETCRAFHRLSSTKTLTSWGYDYEPVSKQRDATSNTRCNQPKFCRKKTIMPSYAYMF